MDQNEMTDEKDQLVCRNPNKKYRFCPLYNYLIEYRGLSWAAKICYARLNQYAGDDGICYPKQETIAKEMNLSTRQIYSLIKELESERFIVTIKATGTDKLMHKSDRYLILDHPIMEDRFLYDTKTGKHTLPSDQKFSSGLHQEGTSGPIEENYIKEVNSNELTRDFQEPEISLSVVLKKRKNPCNPPNQSFDRNKLNNIAPSKPPVVEKARLKPTIEVHSILDFWKNLGLKAPKETTKTHKENIQSLNLLLKGRLLGEPYGKQQILDSIKNFSLASHNYDYAPVKKDYLTTLYLHQFLHNPFSNNGNSSLFKQYLEPPELLKQTAKLIPAKNPTLVNNLKKWYIDNILGTSKVEFSSFDENNFTTCGNRIIDFYQANRQNLKLGIVSNGVFDLAKHLCEALKADAKNDLSVIEPSWFKSDRTFSIRLPKYLNSRGMLKRKISQHANHSESN